MVDTQMPDNVRAVMQELVNRLYFEGLASQTRCGHATPCAQCEANNAVLKKAAELGITPRHNA